MCNSVKTTAVVLAGGRGSRMGSDIPKQYMPINGYPLIYYSLMVFENSFVDEIILVCGSGDEEYCEREIVDRYNITKVSAIVAGGKERYHSVMNGLMAVKECDVVFIHDGARPFITCDILERALEDTLKTGATVVGVPSKDTVKIVDEDTFTQNTPQRDRVWIIQTPQTFRYQEILEAYKSLIKEEKSLEKREIKVTDDAMVMEMFGNCHVKCVMGDYRNIKVTTPEDILVAKAYLDA